MKFCSVALSFCKFGKVHGVVFVKDVFLCVCCICCNSRLQVCYC